MASEMNAMVNRFNRQLLLSEVGVHGQRKLAGAKVIIIGCGGLGSPVTLYLTAAGVGEIGLVDGDVVALNNLHRQIMFSECNIDQNKADCAANACRRLNSGIVVTTYTSFLKPETACDLVGKYDLVVDCTDNPASRYLINDACVISGKPLVFASALRWEGQLTIYDSRKNDVSGQRNGPCYRCVFPEPPPADAVGTCAMNGVLGPVVGVMGSLQAVEAIKFITGQKDTLVGRLLLFDGLTMRFRVVQLRSARPDCPVCGTNPSLTSLTQQSPLTIVYSGTSNAQNACFVPLKLLEPSDRISPTDFEAFCKKNGDNHVLVDVRPSVHFEVCHIEGAINIPLSELASRFSEIGSLCKEKFNGSKGRIVTICRRGNDSQRAVLVIREHLKKSLQSDTTVCDIVGGVTAWKEVVDANFILL